MSKFSKELCAQLQIDQNISTAYHPQTDGQSEQSNQWLEQYLQIYSNFQQDDWAQWLPITQYVHNSWPSTTTRQTPFDLLIGFTPRIRENQQQTTNIPEIEYCIAHLKTLRDHAQTAIWRTQMMTQKYAE
jgi:hypothetical protein